MTFDEFNERLPPGIIGALMRRHDTFKLWSIKLWVPDDKVAGDAANIMLYIRGRVGETAEQLFERALPVAKAYLEAIKEP